MTTYLHNKKIKLILAFSLIYFIWGSTYLGIRYAIETMPPFLMASARFLIAGCLMYTFLRFKGAPNPSIKQWCNLGVVGVFMLLGGNGFVAWAEQYISSGLAALLVSLLPLWLIALDWLWIDGPRPTWQAMLGIAFGIFGVALIVDPTRIMGSSVHLAGAGMVILASLLWAIGSIYSKKFKHPKSIFMSAACQMIVGGVSLLITSVLLGEPTGFTLASVSAISFFSFCYLTIAGSMIAITAYAWLLQNASATSVSTYALVNPAVAIFLGWLIADEALTPPIMLGAFIILLGVFLVISQQRKRTEK